MNDGNELRMMNARNGLIERDCQQCELNFPWNNFYPKSIHFCNMMESTKRQREEEEDLVIIPTPKRNTFLNTHLGFSLLNPPKSTKPIKHQMKDLIDLITVIVNNCKRLFNIYENAAHTTFIINFKGTEYNPIDYMDQVYRGYLQSNQQSRQSIPGYDINERVLTLKYWTINNEHELVIGSDPVEINIGTISDYIYQRYGENIQSICCDTWTGGLYQNSKKIRVIFESKDNMDEAQDALEEAHFEEANNLKIEYVGRSIVFSKGSDGLSTELDVWDEY